MSKMDKQNRLVVPHRLIKISKTDFSKEVRLFVRGKELFLDNASSRHSSCNCLGQVLLDTHNRFFVPKLAREILNLKSGDNFSFYVQNGSITFKKVFFIPENR